MLYAITVISFYLANRMELDAWVAQEQAETEHIRKETETRFDQTGIRERLLQRKTDQRGSG